MKKYKLTNQDLQTRDGFQWELGKKFTTNGEGELCGSGFLHYYHHPVLAVLLNPIHAGITNPRLFEVETGGIHKDDDGLKGGCTEMVLIREIPLPKVTTTQRVAFSILVSLDVYKDRGYKEWAENWLSGKDRSRSAAESAARSAAWSFGSAALSAARAAESADWSAESPAWSAESAAWSALYAAKSAAWSALSVAESVAWSAGSAEQILNKLIECAEKCLEY